MSGDNGREVLLTPDEVTSWLRIPRSWLYQRIHSRSLPFRMVKVGRYVRFPESGIQEYLVKQESQVKGGA
jgi:excisionase family DNA binding protein